MIVSIEGNIGSGKTTLLRMLKKKLNGYIGRSKRVVYVDEPVASWEAIRDEDGRSMLDLLYSEPKIHSFAFQMMAYITRYNAIKKAVQENPGAIVITERCLQTDAEVFAKMLHDSGDIMGIHYSIYHTWAQSFSKEFEPDLVVYVRAIPSISLERVKKRARTSESTISLAYLTQCHLYHETWIMSSISRENKIVLDANTEFVGEGGHTTVSGLVDTITKFIL